ncbi:MAG TPA: TspO/MBR family protein [Rhizomicrobium sp.]|nr:TspO/MBR family protein [Rhizomicrobium sp.]
MSFLDSTDPKSAGRRPLYCFLLASLAVGAAASLYTETNLPIWYASLARPSFAPPAWILPPIWTALYVLMAVAAWRAWKIVHLKSTAMALYALQLAFTFVWTALFFGRHQMGIALTALALLVLLRLATFILFWQKDRLAGLLFLPVMAWALFESFLVFAFQALNG